MEDYLHNIPRIYDGLEHLLKHDEVFADRGINLQSFKWPYMGPGFAGLVRIVVGQQLSTAAAATIWKRFEDHLPLVSPNAVLTIKDEEMRQLGLSHQKAKYIRGLAKAVREKTFDPRLLERMTDEEVYKSITALNGFGDWSAEMYLMFGMARPDIWPAGDLGIQEGLRIYLKKRKRPSADEVKKFGKKFAPHRTAASLLLWHLKGLER